MNLNWLTVGMSLLVLIPGVAFAQAKGPETMSTLEVIHNRKSVRNFTGEAVSKQDLETILKAGMAAPTAVNRQPWAFVVVTEPNELRALAKGLPYAKMLGKAGAAIIVCVVPKKAFDGKPEFAVIDGTLASENILLAVEALGLGAVWTAVYPEPEREEMVRRTLSIPADIIPLNVIPVGHPTGEDRPKEKYRAENVHWEKW
jgi:nitroreductase